ncbi:Hemolysin secretion protein D, chromosomal [invertebrate metagenome]|uniref:Hemolysin secretion protein D, chromosomal n=1 Tax=invertebrate metagenome TaxID=1711999 RepID=A0A2H9T277_9ZZZZ
MERRFPVFSDVSHDFNKNDFNKEYLLFEKREQQRINAYSIADEKMVQEKIQRRELEARIGFLKENLSMASKELSLMKAMESNGAVSEVELLRQKSRVNDLESQLSASVLSVERCSASLNMAFQNKQEINIQFYQKTAEQLKNTELRMRQLEEIMNTHKDRIERTLVKSPVEGKIKTIYPTTIGAVLQPGSRIMEIVPCQEKLMIEAKIPPKDIAFLHPGLPAIVKVSAYDYTTYGGIKGVLESISVDAIESDNNRMQGSYYLVKVKTDGNHIGSIEKPIISGMQITVDIATGKQSLLKMLFKPVLRASENALHER